MKLLSLALLINSWPLASPATNKPMITRTIAVSISVKPDCCVLMAFSGCSCCSFRPRQRPRCPRTIGRQAEKPASYTENAGRAAKAVKAATAGNAVTSGTPETSGSAATAGMSRLHHHWIPVTSSTALAALTAVAALSSHRPPRPFQSPPFPHFSPFTSAAPAAPGPAAATGRAQPRGSSARTPKAAAAPNRSPARSVQNRD